jgi:hypothetical protein
MRQRVFFDDHPGAGLVLDLSVPEMCGGGREQHPFLRPLWAKYLAVAAIRRAAARKLYAT